MKKGCEFPPWCYVVIWVVFRDDLPEIMHIWYINKMNRIKESLRLIKFLEDRLQKKSIVFSIPFPALTINNIKNCSWLVKSCHQQIHLMNFLDGVTITKCSPTYKQYLIVWQFFSLVLFAAIVFAIVWGWIVFWVIGFLVSIVLFALTSFSIIALTWSGFILVLFYTIPSLCSFNL